MRILFDSKSESFKKPFGPIIKNNSCEIHILIPQEILTKDVKIEFFYENSSFYTSFPLYLYDSRDDGYEDYTCSFKIEKQGLYFYKFFIKTKNEEFSLYKYGYDATNMEDGLFWQLSVLPDDYSVPCNYSGNIMYQIFPDRFFKYGKCDLSEKLKPFTIHEDTASIPSYAPNEYGKVLNNDFYGGNLKGIEEKLGYLKSLGISVIYLNPIFKAFSNHRYDTADYKKIDELLGTEEDLISLVNSAHNMGIKIILDGVFSHTGDNSIYFDRYNIFGDGAYSNPDSPYRNWFDFQEYPTKYTSWWGIDTLPCVNELNNDFLDYLIRNEDSVIAHWLDLGIDGFRLDVADELPDEFISILRKRMKEINENALLLGEVWEDASNKISYNKRRTYFTEGELDSVMNYPFRNSIIDFVKGLDNGEKLKSTIMTICENYPHDVVNNLMNFLSTHDTARIFTVLGCDVPPNDKAERAIYSLSFDELQIADKRFSVSLFLLFILPGIPCIFYGDEIGTEGWEDPFCRSYFRWDKVSGNSITENIRLLSAIRNTSPVLKTGKTNITLPLDYVLKIERTLDGHTFSAYINMSDADYYIEGFSVITSHNTKKSGKGYLVSKYGYILLN